MSTKVRCILKSISQKGFSLELPHDCPVAVGRIPELQIIDKTCSRKQLELRANCDKKYVLVKRFGPNPSQIDGIEVHRHVSSKLEPEQTLYLVNMKHPHEVVFEGMQKDSNDIPSTVNGIESVVKSQPDFSKKRKGNKLDQSSPAKKARGGFELGKLTDSENEDTNQSLKSKGQPSISASKSSAHWSQGLKSSMNDPKLIVFQDDKVVAIKDKYPKAKFHWLVLPQENISNPYQLKAEHFDLIEHIFSVGRKLADAEMAKEKALQFRFGFHAVASMSQLHMHVISQDFDSACMKTKKHWNSFTTSYFVDAQEIIEDLDRDGKVKNRRSHTHLLKNALKCHRCGKSQKNMPTLKRHILNCKKT